MFKSHYRNLNVKKTKKKRIYNDLPLSKAVFPERLPSLQVQGFDHRAAVKSPEQSPVWHRPESSRNILDYLISS